MNIRKWAVIALLAALAPSCKTWARIPTHNVTIVLDKQVSRGADLAFCVNLTDANGQQVHGAAYEYKVMWVGLEGSMHKAKTGTFDKIRVKGAVGTASFHVFGYDAQDKFGEIAKQTFEVQ